MAQVPEPGVQGIPPDQKRRMIMGRDLAARTRQNAAQRGTRPNSEGQVEQNDDAVTTMAHFINGLRGQMARALPKHMDADRMARHAMTVLRRNTKLAGCSTESFAGALLTAAALGLEPGVNDECYLVPYKMWDKEQRRGWVECQLIIGYQGYSKQFYQHPLALDLTAHAVYEADEFDWQYGTSAFLHHKPSRQSDRGEVIDYYALARLTSGATPFVVLSPDEVKVLRRGKVGSSGDIPDPQRWMERKGLAVDTPIPTPNGWATMGELVEGQMVIDMDGRPVRVRETSPVKNIGCYRVTFGNGQSIVCDEEHYWLARVGWKRGRTRWDTLQICELFDAKQAGKPVTMPVVAPLDLPPSALPVDPWTLGFWLGDGSTGAARVTVHVSEVEEVSAGIERGGYVVGQVRLDPRNGAANIGIRSNLSKALAELGVLGHKHVPGTYLRASSEQRLAILRGLMDADGCIDAPRGRVYFTNTNEHLADAVAELARSLGEQVSRNVQIKKGFGKTAKAYIVMWQPTVCPFTLTKKANRFRSRTIANYRTVKNIERIASVPTRCIGVDSPTRTYLAGWDMVPTHNTAVRQLAKLLPKSTGFIAAVDADERDGSDLLRERVAERSNAEVIDLAPSDFSETQPDSEPPAEHAPDTAAATS
ncbi:recombinase RecT [Nocardia sp. NPDC051756]|uniref:recombinase RecT n=1 Tax=Nocardia sp. NPDC051756 TaxID=3154751 RepID=UPI003437F21A